jgi:hypothetical protein
LLHFSGLKIQVRHIDHIFRVYIKSRGPNTICRVEETRRPNKPAIEAIDQIFNPHESLESQVTVLRKMVTNLEHKIVEIDPGVKGQVISDSSKDNKNESYRCQV